MMGLQDINYSKFLFLSWKGFTHSTKWKCFGEIGRQMSTCKQSRQDNREVGQVYIPEGLNSLEKFK